MALSGRAEGLRYLSLAQAWELENPTPERLEAAMNRASGPDFQLTWNLEAPKNYFKGDAGRCLGHCWTLAMRGRTTEGADVIQRLLQASAMDYESAKPSFADFESHALIHAQGGAVFYTHPARWWTGPWGGEGGYPKQEKMRVSNMAVELPLDTLLGPTFDGLDVITGAGEFQADQKAFQIWALLLNHGYRVAATASSDACFDRPGGAVPGTARLYTLSANDSSPAVGAARAARAGQTFATTGPLVIVSVDGEPPGSAFAADGKPHRLSIEAWASGAAGGGLGRMEILRNGEPAPRRTLEPSEAGSQAFHLEGQPVFFQTNLVLRATSNNWYCVRVFGTNESRQRAISGAFFFEERPWRSPAPLRARIRARVMAADTGQAVAATLTEVQFLGTEASLGAVHRLSTGAATLSLPGTRRLRAEAPGFEPLTLSPVFDHPPLVEFVTRLQDKDLVDWSTFERIREMLSDVPLTFQLVTRDAASGRTQGRTSRR